MSFEIKQATRVGIKPLIGLYGESGCGKTMSALLLARGFVSDAGKILMIDTESGRGSLYADVIKGGYDVLEMREPFSSARYIEAIRAAEDSGANILVVDSASHEHEGIGGVTDMAMQISKARADKYNKDWDGVVQFGDWKQPKMEHQRFMLKLLQSTLPIIVCLRAKYKTRQIRGTKEMADAGAIKQNDIGKSIVLKDEFTSPIQAEDFIYEMTAHAEVLQNHSIVITKASHPTLKDCFPTDRKTMISMEHGQRLSAWCKAAGNPIPKKLDDTAALKKKIWDLTMPKHNGSKSVLRQFLVDDCGLDFDKTLEDLTAPEIEKLIKTAQTKL